MPVYYNEADARKDFIEKRVDDNPNITVDTSYFLTWLYADEMYDAPTFNAYEDLMTELMKEFPNTTHSEALSSITEVFVSKERVWADGWSDYIKNNPIRVNKELIIDYDPSLPDC